MKNGRSHAGVVGVIAAVSVVAAVVTIGASAHTAAAPNLLKNGGADLGPAVNDSSGIVETIPSWTRLGSFTVVTYGAPGGFPERAISQKIGGKANFFAGGPANPKSTVTQVVDVSRFKGAVDAGKRKATLSGFLGGFAGERSPAERPYGVDQEVRDQAGAEGNAVDPSEAQRSTDER